MGETFRECTNNLRKALVFVRANCTGNLPLTALCRYHALPALMMRIGVVDSHAVLDL